MCDELSMTSSDRRAQSAVAAARGLTISGSQRRSPCSPAIPTSPSEKIADRAWLTDGFSGSDDTDSDTGQALAHAHSHGSKCNLRILPIARGEHGPWVVMKAQTTPRGPHSSQPYLAMVASALHTAIPGSAIQISVTAVILDTSLARAIITFATGAASVAAPAAVTLISAGAGDSIIAARPG